VPIEHNIVSKAIENAQVRVEGYNFDIRKHVLQYDDVVNKQREIIYAQRRQILSEPSMRPTIMGMIEDELRRLVEMITTDNESGKAISLEREQWDLDALAGEVNKIIPLHERFDPEQWRALNARELADELVAMAEKAYDEREQAIGEGDMRRLERLVMLRIVDNRWIRHLTDLDELREGIGLRAFAQQDPLVAYKREASEMYADLMVSIAHDVAYTVFHVQLMTRPAAPPVRQIQTNRSDAGSQPARASSKGQIGRNDPCWCGSGKKYKQCHMREDQGRAPTTATAGAGSAGNGAPPPAQPAQRPAAKAQGGKPPAKSGKRH
jgi:preprotein translocase subunit SecA